MKKSNKNLDKTADAIIEDILTQTNPYPYKKQKCCICKKYFVGYGNNPAPVKHEGRCCDACNTSRVIPTRIYRFQQGMDMRA